MDEIASALQSCSHEKILFFLQSLPEEPIIEAVQRANLHLEIKIEQVKRGIEFWDPVPIKSQPPGHDARRLFFTQFHIIGLNR